jgi:hypothetical protein
MTRDTAGNTNMFFGLHSSCEDMARFGYLFLRHGTWNGHQIVRGDWVDAATGQPSRRSTRSGSRPGARFMTSSHVVSPHRDIRGIRRLPPVVKSGSSTVRRKRREAWQSMSASPSLLEEVLPRFDAREVHDIWVPARPPAAFAAVKQVTVREVRLLLPLEALRRLPGRVMGCPAFRPAASALVLDEFTAAVVPLGERPGAEIAAGAIGRFWRWTGNEPVAVPTLEAFVSFAEPGYAKAVIGFAVCPERDGSRVITETRVAGTSPDGTRALLRYWRAIRLGSGAIRRSWLAAIRRRAVRM